MARYAIAFDLDTKAMKAAGLSDAERTRIYQTEIPQALYSCGFKAHPQGSLYHTVSDQDQIPAIMTLQGALKSHAPSFCKYVRRVHVFRMEEWSDVTALIAEKSAEGPPDAEEEIAESDDIALAQMG
jgi:virulence-associated protein VapD